MATTAAIPVTVSPEAEAFIAEVGQQREFEILLEHTKQVVADLRAIEVTLDDTPETGPPGVILWAHRTEPWKGDDPTDRNWGEWFVQTFPPEVCQNFVILSIYPPDGR
jgi:hypothetical protein